MEAVFEDNDKKPGLSTSILSATQDLTNVPNLCILLGVVQAISIQRSAFSKNQKLPDFLLKADG